MNKSSRVHGQNIIEQYSTALIDAFCCDQKTRDFLIQHHGGTTLIEAVQDWITQTLYQQETQISRQIMPLLAAQFHLHIEKIRNDYEKK